MNKKKQALLTILDTKAIYPVFQPIVDLETCQVVAYESLSRIGNKELYMNIEELFKVAEAYGYVWKLEKLCRDKALETSVNKPLETKIFLNVDGQIFQDSNFISGFTFCFFVLFVFGFTNRKLERFGLLNEDIVFEITERTDIENYVLLQSIMNHYIDQGYQIALDDVGAGYSGLNRVVNTTPNYLKADIELVRNIHLSKSKQSMMKLLVNYCDEMGLKLIAEGIETQEELECICNLHVHYGQGYYLGIPERKFNGVASQALEYLIPKQ